jgi:hypothetical protein
VTYEHRWTPTCGADSLKAEAFGVGGRFGKVWIPVSTNRLGVASQR